MINKNVIEDLLKDYTVEQLTKHAKICLDENISGSLTDKDLKTICLLIISSPNCNVSLIRKISKMFKKQINDDIMKAILK